MKKIKIALALLIALTAFVPPSAAAGFGGEWRRTNVEKTDSATITITNVTGKSFEFSFEGFRGHNTGELDGTAAITEANKAAYEFMYDDRKVKLEFVLNGGELTVSSEGDMYGMFGMGVYIEGEYTKGEPVYTNSGIVADVLGDNAERVKKLLGEEAFEGLVQVMEDGTSYEAERSKYSGYIRGAGMSADLLVEGDKIYCLGLNLDDKYDGYTFYTNDKKYAKSLPDFMKENLNDAWELSFSYKDLE